MKTTTKLLLFISLTAWLIGLTTNVLWGIGMRIGAIFFGWFLIFKLLEKEVAQFDEEQRRRLASIARHSADIPNPRTTGEVRAMPSVARASA